MKGDIFKRSLEYKEIQCVGLKEEYLIYELFAEMLPCWIVKWYASRRVCEKRAK